MNGQAHRDATGKRLARKLESAHKRANGEHLARLSCMGRPQTSATLRNMQRGGASKHIRGDGAAHARLQSGGRPHPERQHAALGILLVKHKPCAKKGGQVGFWHHMWESAYIRCHNTSSLQYRHAQHFREWLHTWPEYQRLKLFVRLQGSLGFPLSLQVPAQVRCQRVRKRRESTPK